MTQTINPGTMSQNNLDSLPNFSSPTEDVESVCLQIVCLRSQIEQNCNSGPKVGIKGEDSEEKNYEILDICPNWTYVQNEGFS